MPPGAVRPASPSAVDVAEPSPAVARRRRRRARLGSAGRPGRRRRDSRRRRGRRPGVKRSRISGCASVGLDVLRAAEAGSTCPARSSAHVPSSAVGAWSDELTGCRPRCGRPGRPCAGRPCGWRRARASARRRRVEPSARSIAVVSGSSWPPSVSAQTSRNGATGRTRPPSVKRERRRASNVAAIAPVGGVDAQRLCGRSSR